MLSDKRLLQRTYTTLKHPESGKIMNSEVELSTQVSGSAGSGTATAGKIGLTMLTMKAIGSWVEPMERVPSITLTATCMKVSGEMTWPMVMASTSTQTAHHTKGSGRMTYRMV